MKYWQDIVPIVCLVATIYVVRRAYSYLWGNQGPERAHPISKEMYELEVERLHEVMRFAAALFLFAGVITGLSAVILGKHWLTFGAGLVSFVGGYHLLDRYGQLSRFSETHWVESPTPDGQPKAN